LCKLLLIEMENKNFRFALGQIKTDQFAIIESAYKANEDVNLKIGLQYGSNKDEKLLSVKVSVQFEQYTIPFIIMEATCFFHIEPSDWELLIVENGLLIPKVFITHLPLLTIGTVRGILHAKTEGTNFNGFVLPTVNVTELVTTDISL